MSEYERARATLIARQEAVALLRVGAIASGAPAPVVAELDRKLRFLSYMETRIGCGDWDWNMLWSDM